MERIISSKIVFECPIFKVEECNVEIDGKVEKRWYILRRDAVAVVPITKDKKIVLIREYRSAVGEWVWWLPGGGVKEGENPEEAAKRELLEETGYYANKIKHLFTLKFPSAVIKQRTHYFMAWDLEKREVKKEEKELIEIHELSFEEVRRLICNAEIETRHAKAILKAIEKYTRLCHR